MDSSKATYTLAVGEVKEWLYTVLDHADSAQHSEFLDVISTSQNPSSTGWSFLDTKTHKRIYVKHHSEDWMYRNEKDSLLLLSPYSNSTERYAVPQMIGWNDELKLIALNWLEGEPVDYKLGLAVSRRGTKKNFREGCKLTQDIGRWLHHFEKRTSSTQLEGFPSVEILQRIIELNKFISKTGLPGFNQLLITSIEETVRHELSLLKDKYEFCLVHRDFWFGHILKCKKNIVVMDYGRCTRGPKGRDAVQFYLKLGDLSMYNPMVSDSKVRELQSEFIHGYGNIDFSAHHIFIYVILIQLEQLGGIVEQVYQDFVLRYKAKLYAHAKMRSIRRLMLNTRNNKNVTSIKLCE